MLAVLGILISVAFIQEASWQLAAAESIGAAGETVVEEAPVLPERRGLARLTGAVRPQIFFAISPPACRRACSSG